LILICSVVSAQDVKSDIEKEYKAMNQAMVDGEFAKVADLVSDELFTILPKEQFVGMLEMMMNNPQLEINLSVPDVLSIGEVMKVEEKYYAVLDTYSEQKMRFFNADGQTAKLADSPQTQQTYETWKTQLGEDNVSYDEDSGYFTVNVKQKALAISADGETGWKFLNLDENTKRVIEKVVPEAVLSQI
ncbi:MAG: hypothetical protein AAFO69_21380, partial [Bacteroidota bacterium]